MSAPVLLPVATGRRAGRVVEDLLRASPVASTVTALSTVAASAAGLIAPVVLGALVDAVADAQRGGGASVWPFVGALLGAAVLVSAPCTELTSAWERSPIATRSAAYRGAERGRYQRSART